MFVLNKQGTIALNLDYVLYIKTENDTDRLRANDLLFSGEHYSLTLHYGAEHDGKLIRFYGNSSKDDVEEKAASVLLAYNNGLRIYDLKESPDQYNNVELMGREPDAYWILCQNPAQAVNLRKCSQVRILDVTNKYRMEHPVSQDEFYAIVATYNKLAGYDKVTLFTTTSLDEAKAALHVLMYSFGTGRKMLDYSGFANTVFERYEEYKGVKEEFGI